MAKLPALDPADVWGGTTNAAIRSLTQPSGIHSARIADANAEVGTLFPCTTHGVVERFNGTTWETWTPGPAVGTTLATTIYAPGTDPSITVSSTTLADVDATNMSVTFTTPANGEVLIEGVVPFIIEMGNTSGQGVNLGLREGTSQVGSIWRGHYLANFAIASYAAGANLQEQGTLRPRWRITGLTPGSTHTYKLAALKFNSTVSPSLHADSGAVWGPMSLTVHPTGLVSTGSLLSAKSYSPAADVSWTSTVATFADADATNAAVTFTAPSSGSVAVVVTAAVVAPSSALLGLNLREGTTDLSVPVRVSGVIDAPVTFTRYITGLTPGSTHTYKLGIRRTSGTGTVQVSAGPSWGSLTIEVFDRVAS